jgi:hypothetical protein
MISAREVLWSIVTPRSDDETEADDARHTFAPLEMFAAKPVIVVFDLSPPLDRFPSPWRGNTPFSGAFMLAPWQHRYAG